MSAPKPGRSFTRRGFLRSAFAFAAHAWLLQSGGCAGSAGCPACVPRPRHSRRVLADLHAHPLINEWNSRSYAAAKLPQLHGAVRRALNRTSLSWKTSHEAGIDLICAAHFNVFDEWLSMPSDPNPDAPSNTLRMIDQLEEELAGPAARYAALARNAAELESILSTPRASADFRTAVVHSIEGGHSLGGTLDALDAFSARGVAIITLTHFFNKGVASSANAYPFFPDGGAGWTPQGLSEFGKAIIERMERLGMIVDVTHATPAALEDVLRIARRPFCATHASSRTLSEHALGLYDEHVQEISRRRGVVGVILNPFTLGNYSSYEQAQEKGSLEDVARNVRHLVKVCGTHRRVALGSDFSGYIVAPREMRCLGEIDALRSVLLREFDGDEMTVEDIMANNAIEFLLKNWGPGGTHD